MAASERRKSASSLAELIPDVVEDLGVGDRLDQARIEEAWRQVAGEQIGRVIGRVRLSGDRLTVEVTSSAWRQALTMQREDWRARLNEAVGAERVREIVFR